MSNRNHLKTIIESLEYDDGLMGVLRNGCSTLPEIEISKLLSNLNEVQNSIPALLEMADSVILGPKQARKQTTENRQNLGAVGRVRGSARKVRVSNGALTTPASIGESLERTELVVDTKSKDGQVPAVENDLFKAAQTISLAYFGFLEGALATSLHSYELLLGAMHRDALRKLFEPSENEVVAAAVKSSLNAANTAFDQMTKMAKQLTEIADANAIASTRAADKAAALTHLKRKK